MGDQGGGCSHLHAQSTLDAHKPQGRRQFLCTCHHPNTCARALLAEHRTPPATTRMQWCGAAPTNCGEPLGGSSCLYHVSWCRNGYLPRTGSRIWALRGPHGRPSPELRKRFQTRTAPWIYVLYITVCTDAPLGAPTIVARRKSRLAGFVGLQYVVTPTSERADGTRDVD